MFKKILIANRGEIACRVIKTARRLGIETVAVYSDADRNARHVEAADEAVRLGAPPSRESYLCGDKIMAAARASGAEAIHPGYGFLSENEAFARQVEDSGLVFIGPQPASIAAMGDKIASKKIAIAAGVATIAGWNDAIPSVAAVPKIASDIGYPVMIKASAGGGGKGLRVAHDEAQACAGFEACRNEARASFGDDRVFIEKFIEQPRHVEIQVLGDRYGNVIYLNERECSIQRRHQKIVEEAPSPFISDTTRRAMGEQAVALAHAVHYQSAGTVEFVVGADQRFYFLEMNTRLQVEHPVTECITGLDLVELMLRIAAGERLPLTQADVRREGWAIECRINAEDPSRNFLPSTGRLVRFQPPQTTMEAAQATPHDGGVRIDTGVDEGGEISVFYDPMIAKLIVYARDRTQAIARLREALNGFVIRGISSNIAFLTALLEQPQFVAGSYDTGFIAAHYPDGFIAQTAPHQDPLFLVALAAHMHRKEHARAAGISGQMPGEEAQPVLELVALGCDAENNTPPYRIRFGAFDAALGLADVTIDDSRRYRLECLSRIGDIRQTGTVNGVRFVAQIDRGLPPSGLGYRVRHNGTQVELMLVSPRAAELWPWMRSNAAPQDGRLVLSPMPGLLAAIVVAAGQSVRAGQALAVIEAMKMENTITASRDGVVDEWLAVAGESVAVDQPLLRFRQS